MSRGGRANWANTQKQLSKGWPFVESPLEFTTRLRAALVEFDDMLAAVRHVLIEKPPQLAAVDDGMRAAMVKLSKALGHPKEVSAGATQCIEAALIEMAAERLTSKPVLRAQCHACHGSGMRNDVHDCEKCAGTGLEPIGSKEG